VVLTKEGSDIKLNSVKFSILLVGKVSGNGGVAYYSVDSSNGEEVSKKFIPNMGVTYYPYM
jgi:hypothetical protein